MGVIIKEIKDKHLLENVLITGNWLKAELFALNKQYPNLIMNIRGQGTFLAFDLESTAKRDQLTNAMRLLGIASSGCGSLSIRLRPMLIFKPEHAAIYLDRLATALKNFK